jgi:2-keto-4-pentenoate hydratase/2-oxohepta-3-ene-1,7-dioic acid hydratase in catechol pathway
MRIANVGGRLTIVMEAGGIDVERASAGRFPADPAEVYPQWTEFLAWARGALSGAVAAGNGAVVPVDEATLGAPSPRPAQVFAIGLNYGAHALESGYLVPEVPVTFTKFPTCITGPHTDLGIPGDSVDWEVELVAVIGTRAEAVPVEDAWRYVAGLTIGQDYSERRVQALGQTPQFSLGKSFPGFGHTGPWLDEFDDPDDLALECLVNGEVMQSGRTRDMILSVPGLVSRLSAVCPLLPGDLIFTGTPDGVGSGRTPPVFLRPGDDVVSRIEGIGVIRQRCVAPQRVPALELGHLPRPVHGAGRGHGGPSPGRRCAARNRSIASARRRRLDGRPTRFIRWPSPGMRTRVTSRPSRRSAAYACSLCATGQTWSSWACTSSSGVRTRSACASGEQSSSLREDHGGPPIGRSQKTGSPAPVPHTPTKSLSPFSLTAAAKRGVRVIAHWVMNPP